MNLVKSLVSLGSRSYVLSVLVTSIVVGASECGTVPCEGDACETGGGGSAGEGGAGGDAGAGGDTVGGGGAGGEAGQGGAGGSGGAGGATTSSETGGGGSGGEGGGSCVPSFVCGPKDCGTVEDGCGVMLDCDATEGDPVTCQTQGGGTPGPMTCGSGHVCECPAEGNTAAAMAKCGAQSDNPSVPAWCVENGGCHTRLCGAPPAPKSPENCLYGGGLSDGSQIWCCVDTF